MKASQHNLFPGIASAINQLQPEQIPTDRKASLQSLADYIQTKVAANQPVRLHFICTHNSRRSHLAQIWAQTMAYYFGLKQVVCYSGGTEATALFPAVVKTLKETGFAIQKLSEGSNPIYAIKYAANELPILGFSKTLDDDFNPTSDFAAVMTCDSAKEACPVVLGANAIIPITYEDPKIFDNTPQQGEKYTQRSLQIATELLYVFSQIKL